MFMNENERDQGAVVHRMNLEIVHLGGEAIVSEEVVLGMRHWEDRRHARHSTTFSSNLIFWDTLQFGEMYSICVGIQKRLLANLATGLPSN